MNQTLVVVGAQWGDEGKGKIIDLLTPQADLVVRCQGGANAGHTLVIAGEAVVLHLVPSGIFHPRVECLIGNGVVIDPAICLEELDACCARGCELAGRFWISAQAHVVLPHHRQIDELRETALGTQQLGTTRRGIGPAYEAKARRQGLRCIDLISPVRLEARLRAILPEQNVYLERVLGGAAIPIEKVLPAYRAWGERLRPFVTDTVSRLHAALAAGRRVIFEGAQGTALDLDHGTYPFVTSSTTVAAGACSGSGVGPSVIHRVLGVAKAYCTRVGNGPFPTELTGSLGEVLRARGGEFGATTGRPRRCGWIDTVALRHAVRINGLTGPAVTKLDVLAGLPEVRLGVAYRLGGVVRETFPTTAEELDAATPIYETLPGWPEDAALPTSQGALPPPLQHFLTRLEALIGIPVQLLSVGPARSQHLVLQSCW